MNQTPKEFDTELAALYGQADKAARILDSVKQTILGAAGAKYYYRGRNRVTDMTVEEARPVVEALLADGKYLSHGYSLKGYGADDPTVIDRYDTAAAELAAIHEAIARKADGYTGWSRFFLVTSSKGHIHSSMNCSTCYLRTTYGWLPSLSGETEAQAVAEHGEVLCSICFPTAPVAWTTGTLSKAQAERKAVTA